MMAVWATDGEVVCVHPMGPRLSSRELISASWRQILTGGPRRNFKIELKAVWGGTDYAVHIVNEIISVPHSELQFTPVLATNVYAFSGNSWYIVAHHASIDASRNLASPTTDTEAHTRH